MEPQTRLEVDRRWTGAQVPPAERARVDLHHGIEGHLAVRVDAPFHDDPAPSAPVGWTDGLWEHEVVELFIAGPGGYLELEVGPHGHHLALFFERVRVRTDQRLELPPFEVTRTAGRWQVELCVPTRWLPAGANRACAFAVHGVAPDRVHLTSHRLPGAKPDFHQPDAFPAVTLRDPRGVDEDRLG